MTRYTGRGVGATNATTPKFFSLAKQLANRRAGLRATTSKIAPIKPSLTSSKQKEAEIQKTLEKSYLPSGLKLAKLRQLAAQHKILGERSRDFLHRSAGGEKVQGTEGLKKFESELVEAEVEAIEMQGGHDPRKFEFRKDGIEHLDRTAKRMVKGLYHEATQQAAADAAAKHASVMEERQAHQAMIHGILDRQPAGQAASAPAQTSSTPTLQQPTPLTASTPPHSTPFVPMTGGGHITQSDHPAAEPTPIGSPIIVRHEPASAQVTEPVTSTPEPAPSTPAVPDVRLPDMSHLSDPFGGDD